MEKKINRPFEYEIDVMHILRTIWKKMWIIVICAVLCAALGFSYAAFYLTPSYSSSAMLYVNNKSFSLGGTSVSVSTAEISAAQSLVKTYITILKTRTTLEQVIEATGVNYSWQQLMGMISAGSVNSTEVFKVTVTANDPYVAAKIVNGIAEVLPERVADIIQGSSVKIVDSGIVNSQKIAPNVRKYTMSGFFGGLLVAAAAIAIYALFDDTIRGEDYVLQKYDYPILARIPDLIDEDSAKYKRYRYGYRYGYKYGYKRSQNKDKSGR